MDLSKFVNQLRTKTLLSAVRAANSPKDAGSGKSQVTFSQGPASGSLSASSRGSRKIRFGEVPGGGYKPERGRGEIPCFSISCHFLFGAA